MTTLFEELFKPDSRAYPKNCNWIKSSDDVYTAEFELAGFSKKEVTPRTQFVTQIAPQPVQ